MTFRPVLFAPVLFSLSLPGLFSAPAAAQTSPRFDPFTACAESLPQASADLRPMIAGWILGYMEAGLDSRSTFATDEAEQVLGNLESLCQSYPDRSLAAIMAAIVTLEKRDRADAADAATAPAPAPAPAGSEADARALLERFLDPATDRVALTAQLLPTAEDIRAVYEDPFASKLIAAYDGRLARGVEIRANDGQTSLLTWAVSTDELRAGGDAMRNFPMGYRDIAGFLKPGLTMLRFKFVRPGETSGMAYDGLVWVNGRWVWMPKPWRALE